MHPALIGVIVGAVSFFFLKEDKEKAGGESSPPSPAPETIKPEVTPKVTKPKAPKAKPVVNKKTTKEAKENNNE